MAELEEAKDQSKGYVVESNVMLFTFIIGKVLNIKLITIIVCPFVEQGYIVTMKKNRLHALYEFCF